MRNEKMMKIVAWTAVVAMVLTVIVSLIGFLS